MPALICGDNHAMQQIVHTLCWAMLFWQSALAFGEAPSAQGEPTPRETLKRVASHLHWPGGGLWHTAFHRGYTTRYLLLRTCSRSEPLASYLHLSAEQLQTIKQLRPGTQVGDRIEREQISNDEPDEEALQAKYFSFLTREQLLKLDLLAMQYDGFFALTRGSLARATKLSDESQQRIKKLVSEARESYVLPKFRREFAASLPRDYEYEKVLINSSITTQINLQIVDALNDAECARVHQLLNEYFTPPQVRISLRELMELPSGIGSLLTEELRGQENITPKK
jgi:hypothetical protein